MKKNTETPPKNLRLKYIFIAVLIVAATGIWAWRISVNFDAVEPEMVTVQGGRFAMGGNEHNNEKPIHNVTLSGFKIAKYETTQAQWQQVMGSNPFGHKDCMDCPVTGVSWDDIQTFIQKLNTLSGKHYRLPTEAEWEYAARGGTKSKGFEYAGNNDAGAVAWTWANSKSTTHLAASSRRHCFKCCDLSGGAIWSAS